MTDSLVVQLAGRALVLELSSKARVALDARTTPLVVDLELYFSCLIRKRVHFPEQPHADALCAVVNDRLTVCFRPVMSRACAIRDTDGHPELVALPIHRPEAFVPKRLSLDIKRGVWSGEFQL